MKVQIGNYFAKCPYCSSEDFVPDARGESEPIELTCASCGGAASRRLLLEGIGDEAAAAGRESLERMKSARGLKG